MYILTHLIDNTGEHSMASKITNSKNKIVNPLSGKTNPKGFDNPLAGKTTSKGIREPQKPNPKPIGWQKGSPKSNQTQTLKE